VTTGDNALFKPALSIADIAKWYVPAGRLLAV
jgi:hypothetical protein